MNKQFAKLKVYELGGGVAFSEELELIPFLVLPKSQATMKPWGASGFVFENVITGDVIAFVAEFDDVLDSAGVAYGASQFDVMTAVSAFFFELGGGGAAVDVTYDNSTSGLTATDVQAAIDELAAGVNATNLYAKGSYNTFFETTTLGIAYVAFNTALMIYQDFEVLAPVTIDAIKFATNNAPAGQASFTLYKANNSGVPDLKLVEVTFNTATVAGVQIITFAEQTLEAGIYFWAIQSNAAFNLWTTPKSSNQFAFLGREGGVSVSPLLQKYITPHVYATPTPTPATAPTNDFYSAPSAAFFVQSRIKA